MFVLTAITLFVRYPGLHDVLLSASTAGIVVATIASAIGSVLAASRERYHGTFLGAAGLAAAFVVFVGTLLYPRSILQPGCRSVTPSSLHSHST